MSLGQTHLTFKISEVKFRQLCDRLKILINNWLNSADFRSIERKLHRCLDPNDSMMSEVAKSVLAYNCYC